MFGFEGINNVPSAYNNVYSSLAQSVEHLTVNQGVVGSSPTGGAYSECFTYKKLIWESRIPNTCGSMVKRLRHRPFTAVTRVRFPLESLITNICSPERVTDL